MASGFDANHFGSSLGVIELMNGETLVLVGAPHRRRDTLTGYIAAYLINKSNKWYTKRKPDKNYYVPELWNLTSSDFVDGAQMGEQFGHEIVTGDFNGDGKRDFAVSAPTWSDMKHYGEDLKVNVGRVYIFLAVTDSSSEKSQGLKSLLV